MKLLTKWAHIIAVTLVCFFCAFWGGQIPNILENLKSFYQGQLYIMDKFFLSYVKNLCESAEGCSEYIDLKNEDIADAKKKVLKYQKEEKKDKISYYSKRVAVYTQERDFVLQYFNERSKLEQEYVKFASDSFWQRFYIAVSNKDVIYEEMFAQKKQADLYINDVLKELCGQEIYQNEVFCGQKQPAVKEKEEMKFGFIFSTESVLYILISMAFGIILVLTVKWTAIWLYRGSKKLFFLGKEPVKKLVQKIKKIKK